MLAAVRHAPAGQAAPITALTEAVKRPQKP
jgi:hypothetical protein